MNRRAAISVVGLAAAAICCPSFPARALKPGKPSKEALLNRTREEKTAEEIEEEKARNAEKKRLRLEQQKELQAAAERKKAGFDDGSGDSVEIESSLRGNYYFPTARKRYLPRVKLALEELPEVESAVRGNRWPDVVARTNAELTDAVLPMKLYASSLGGGGLSIGASFIQKMTTASEKYEAAVRRLVKSCKKRETGPALDAISTMNAAIAEYRVLGHLEAADFGIGEVAADTRVGSGLGNMNPALYAKNKTMKQALSEDGNSREQLK